MKANKIIGNTFESKFCQLLSKHGFWVHNLAQKASGQPADVIAVKNGKAYLIDCKVCSKGKFVLKRVEENQDLSMNLWTDCDNGYGWFALLINQNIYMLSHFMIKALRELQFSLNESDMCRYGLPLEKWIEQNESYNIKQHNN